MAQYQVELYAVTLLPVSAVEAADAQAAIAKAVADAESHEPLLTGEFVRYVVIPSQNGERDHAHSQTFQDAAFCFADQRDREDGFPLYEPVADDVDGSSSGTC